MTASRELGVLVNPTWRADEVARFTVTHDTTTSDLIEVSTCLDIIEGRRVIMPGLSRRYGSSVSAEGWLRFDMESGPWFIVSREGIQAVVITSYTLSVDGYDVTWEATGPLIPPTKQPTGETSTTDAGGQP